MAVHDSILAQSLIEIDHAISHDGVGEAADLDWTEFLAMNFILDMRIGVVRDEYAAGRSLVLESCSLVHRAPDNGVVHALVAAEISDRAVTRMNAYPTGQRCFYAR